MPQFKWVENFPGTFDLYFEEHQFGWLTKRPSYCDRGHWQLNISLKGLDAQDGFPRYFMQFETAKKEAELFLNWRLNKIRGE